MKEEIFDLKKKISLLESEVQGLKTKIDNHTHGWLWFVIILIIIL